MDKKRTSEVQRLKLISIRDASVVFIGDNLVIDPRSRVLAVQREVADFYGDEGRFETWDVFQRPFPPIGGDVQNQKPEPAALPGKEANGNGNEMDTVQLQIRQESPRIQVEDLSLIGISTSSVLQIGSTSVIDAESRVKYFRQFVYSYVPIKFPLSTAASKKLFRFAAQAAQQGLNQLDTM